jgi:hypothetical protein
MKRIIIVSLLFLIANLGFSQSENIVEQNDTSSYMYDTVAWTGDMIGLNVSPAFGVIGGGTMSASKIFFQYRHMWKKTNLRISANYINYYEDNDNLDVVSVSSDTLMQFRKYNNNNYTVDLRCGIEYAYHVNKFRFYYGAGLIGGYHNYGKDYYLYERNFKENPNLGIEIYDEKIEEGWYSADMLKLGVDFTLGVDFKMADNMIMSIQYAPELGYNKLISSERDDPSKVFVGDDGEELDVVDYWDFRGDFIDIVLSIVF